MLLSEGGCVACGKPVDIREQKRLALVKKLPKGAAEGAKPGVVLVGCCPECYQQEHLVDKIQGNLYLSELAVCKLHGKPDSEAENFKNMEFTSVEKHDI